MKTLEQTLDLFGMELAKLAAKLAAARPKMTAEELAHEALVLYSASCHEIADLKLRVVERQQDERRKALEEECIKLLRLKFGWLVLPKEKRAAYVAQVKAWQEDGSQKEALEAVLRNCGRLDGVVRSRDTLESLLETLMPKKRKDERVAPYYRFLEALGLEAGKHLGQEKAAGVGGAWAKVVLEVFPDWHRHDKSEKRRTAGKLGVGKDNR